MPVRREPLSVGFDEVQPAPGSGGLRVTLGQSNRDRPVWTYWFPLLCALFPESMFAAPVTALATVGAPFVYPIELRFEVDEWCADTPQAKPLAVLPPKVERASAAARVVVVLSIAHEGRTLFAPDANGRSVLLDRVADFGRWYGLPRERLWFVSGNLDGHREIQAWRQARHLTELPFTFRTCEPFSAFVGGCAAQSLGRGRAPIAATTFRRQGPYAIGWRSTEVSWVPRPFPGPRDVKLTPPRFRYACLNRMFRRHRWEVLERLWRADVLDQGLVSFPRPNPDELRFEGVSVTSSVSDLFQLLPLTIDRPAKFEDSAFFSENAAFVGLHPPEVLRDCAMEVVTETCQAEGRFVSEKMFKALMGRGPAVVVGTSGVLSYLHSLGVRTWPHQVAEQYDDIPGAGVRLEAAVGSALEVISRTDTHHPVTDEVRATNLRWLTAARKPWHELVDDIHETVRG